MKGQLMNNQPSSAPITTAQRQHRPRLVLLGIATAALTIGASSAVSASTDTTEPAGEMTEHTEAEHSMDTTAATQAVDSSAEASSPEAEAFCAAAIAIEAAVTSEDPALIESAAEEVVAAAPDDDIRATVDTVLATFEAGGPEFAEAYGALIEYMKANCGYAELNVAASEYAFGGVPPSLVAGPTIVTFANIGEEVHEFIVFRINDDVTLTVEELLALPEEESDSMATPAGQAFAFPGETNHALIDFTPGRYIALCFLPENADPDLIAQMEGPE
jgi:hypothetical protein